MGNGEDRPENTQQPTKEQIEAAAERLLNEEKAAHQQRFGQLIGSILTFGKSEDFDEAEAGLKKVLATIVG